MTARPALVVVQGSRDDIGLPVDRIRDGVHPTERRARPVRA
ncbi:hypothetical protein [Actinomycetospora chiangmaiensis]|nr:hypothetical protein [Actinomycetospora chiangmaiensis]